MSYVSDVILQKEREAAARLIFDAKPMYSPSEWNKRTACDTVYREPTRTFPTGAARDTDNEKYDYEGYLSPLVLERFAQYMAANRMMRDGTIRSGDNWQKGIPLDVYMKSAWRHFVAWWMEHRITRLGGDAKFSASLLEEALCAVLFNVMGYLHEVLKEKRR